MYRNIHSRSRGIGRTFFEAAFAEDELGLVLYDKKDFFYVHTDRTECLFLLLDPVVCDIF